MWPVKFRAFSGSFEVSVMDFPACRRCRFYQATWKPQRPHACRFFGFQSRLLPALEVYRSSGKICPQYSDTQGNSGPKKEPSARKKAQGGQNGILY